MDGTTLAIWRPGIVAYRNARRGNQDHLGAWRAAVAAIMEEHPHLSLDEARQHATNGVAWASSAHPRWFWHDPNRREWIWPPSKDGVGTFRYSDKSDE